MDLRNSMPNWLPACVFAASVLCPHRAQAHIRMTGPLMSRGGDIKQVPCDGNRGGGPVYTYEPGTTITLSVDEYVPHPSYFRIAFDNDGNDNFVEPKSIQPIDPSRPCPFDANDKCGAPDYCNVVSTSGGPTVLWDDLDPHLAGLEKTYSWNVKLPDVECDNCTLQIIQVMEDTIHGAYCPSDSCMDTSLQDVYHLCIDIQLKKGATNGPGVTTDPANNQGMDCVMQSGTGGNSGAGGTTAGSGGSSGSGAAGMSGGAAGAGAAGAPAMGGTFAGIGAGGSITAGAPAIMGGAAGVGPTAAAGAGNAGAPTGVAGGGAAATAIPGSGGTPSTSNDGSSCSLAARGRGAHGARSAWLLTAVAAVFGLRRRRARCT